MPPALRAAAAAALALASASPAAADPPTYRLGATGQFYLTTDVRLDLSFERTRFAAPTGDETEDVTAFAGQFAVDYVIARRITLGGLIGMSAERIDAREAGAVQKDKLGRFDLGARLGYVVPLGGNTALWPRLGLTAAKQTIATRRGTLTGQVATLTVSAPLIWRPVSRIFIGLAPTYQRDIATDYGTGVLAPEHRVFAIHGLIGVWFHGY